MIDKVIFTRGGVGARRTRGDIKADRFRRTIDVLEHFQCKTLFFSLKWSKSENEVKLIQSYFISHFIIE